MFISSLFKSTLGLSGLATQSTDIWVLCVFLFRCFLEINPFPHRAQCYGWPEMASRAESSRAGGARGLGQQGSAVYSLAWWQGMAGPARQRLQMASLVIACFPRLSPSQKVIPVCPHFIINLIFPWSILFSLVVLQLGAGPPSPHIDQRVWVVGACLEALGTQC